MKKLYPPIEPYHKGKLRVSSIHTLYYEESGNPRGIPFLVLHGGPGSASKPDYRRYFNPKIYRIVIFDQRGCGKSTPLGELKENTTWDLVSDIEKLRGHLKIEKWHVYGSSWGSTLALAYAQTHATKVSALLVRGIWTYTKSETDWIMTEKSKLFYPDAWETYSRHLNGEEKKDVFNVLYRKIFSGNPKEKEEAIKDFNFWDEFKLNLFPEAEYKKGKPSKHDIVSTQIFFHYTKNYGFLKEDSLIKNAGKLKNIPGAIIHGRYDMICPLITAWRLHQAWPRAEFIIVECAGHRAANMIPEIIEYTGRLAKFGIA